MAPSLPYHEPSIQTILIQSSFLLALNAVNHVLDCTIYAGLVGQILVGIAWGMPGGKILDLHAQEVIVQLGYIGLILLVFEGGLSTSFASLKANLLLSIMVALTGIAIPMGLSFTLAPMVGATALQAFAAGAALCATSLGTTFTLLASSGLTSSRLGVVLTSAAMMDDVVGLIMVQVISTLGSYPSFDAVTVIRPVFVSLAFAILLPIACRFIVLPVTRLIVAKRQDKPEASLSRLFQHELTALTIHTGILIATVTGATYAGSSSLLGAYIAGATISWWDAEAPHPQSKQQDQSSNGQGSARDGDSTGTSETVDASQTGANENSASGDTVHSPCPPSHTGSHVFEKYYQPALVRILKPFFFASVGFSIPITQMFDGSIVWRGLVYTLLMAVGKLFCGLWLLRVPNPFVRLQHLASFVRSRFQRKNPAAQPTARGRSEKPKKPLSLYPGLILGSAMVARGEIGYLISSIAEGGGIFNNSSRERAAQPGESSEIFLIVTWAITLCTIAGPISMGFLVNRVRKLENKASGEGRQGERTDILGSWGVQLKKS